MLEGRDKERKGGYIMASVRFWGDENKLSRGKKDPWNAQMFLNVTRGLSFSLLHLNKRTYVSCVISLIWLEAAFATIILRFGSSILFLIPKRNSFVNKF